MRIYKLSFLIGFDRMLLVTFDIMTFFNKISSFVRNRDKEENQSTDEITPKNDDEMMDEKIEVKTYDERTLEQIIAVLPKKKILNEKSLIKIIKGKSKIKHFPWKFDIDMNAKTPEEDIHEYLTTFFNENRDQIRQKFIENVNNNTFETLIWNFVIPKTKKTFKLLPTCIQYLLYTEYKVDSNMHHSITRTLYDLNQIVKINQLVYKEILNTGRNFDIYVKADKELGKNTEVGIVLQWGSLHNFIKK